MNIAIIGSGPSAFYTIQGLLRECETVKLDIFEMQPAPFGLARYGVAPDHQKTKNIIRLFAKYLADKKVKFYGNTKIGKDIKLSTLSKLYDAVIISSGASDDKELGVAGSNLKGIIGSAKFVGWYNGNVIHTELNPNLNTKNAVIIGNGNVAIDCARILAKKTEEFDDSDIMDHALKALLNSNVENIYIVGRRSPKEAKFTIAELRELGHLSDCNPLVDFDENNLKVILEADDIDTKIKKNIEVLLSFKDIKKQSRKKIIFKFLSTPHKIIGEEEVEAIIFKKNKLVNNEIVVTDETETIYTKLVIPAIGYKVSGMDDLELDKYNNFYKNKDGYIRDNIYTSGWASGASVGVIGSNKIGANILVKKLLNEIKPNKNNPTKEIENVFKENNVNYISKDDWNLIDKKETNDVDAKYIRKKLANIEEILSLISIKS